MRDALRAYGLDLRDADDGLKGSRDVVFEAVRQNCGALEFADFDLQSDPELQPDRIGRNCVAGPGAAAPSLEAAAPTHASDGRLDVDVVVARMTGEAATLNFDTDATLGD